MSSQSVYEDDTPLRTTFRLIVTGWFSPIVLVVDVAMYLRSFDPPIFFAVDGIPRFVREFWSVDDESVQEALGWSLAWEEVAPLVNYVRVH